MRLSLAARSTRASRARTRRWTRTPRSETASGAVGAARARPTAWAAVPVVCDARRTTTACRTRWAGADTTNSEGRSAVVVGRPVTVEDVSVASETGPGTDGAGSGGDETPDGDGAGVGDDPLCEAPARAAATGGAGAPDAPGAAAAEAAAGAVTGDGAATAPGGAAAADGTGGVVATGGGGAGACGRGAVARGGSSPSGSTYPSSCDATRTPRWTLGTGCSGSPLEPIVATGEPSSTASPFATSTVPR